MTNLIGSRNESSTEWIVIAATFSCSLPAYGRLQGPSLQSGHLQDLRSTKTNGVDHPVAKQFRGIFGHVASGQHFKVRWQRDGVGKWERVVMMKVIQGEGQPTQEIRRRHRFRADVHAGRDAPVG